MTTPACRVRVSPTAVVRSAMRVRPSAWLTAHDLITMTGLTSGQINQAITALTKQGAVDRLSSRGPGQGAQAYRWVTTKGGA